MFELPETTAVRCVNANPRTELHGEERHRAIDLTFEFTTSNEVLDTIAPGLRQHFYTNKAADSAQEALPAVVIPLPNLRYPHLPTENIRWNHPKSRGYRWIWDWGREEQHVDFTDVGLTSLYVTLHEGSSVDTKFTISYNGDELQDNEKYGELCGLAAMGDVHMQLFAPAEFVPVKKGWRSGKVDAPPLTDGGAPLLDGPADGPTDTDNHDEGTGPDDAGSEHPEGSPEAALAGAVAADAKPNSEAAWPFPPKTKRGGGAAAAH